MKVKIKPSVLILHQGWVT